MKQTLNRATFLVTGVKQACKAWQDKFHPITEDLETRVLSLFVSVTVLISYQSSHGMKLKMTRKLNDKR